MRKTDLLPVDMKRNVRNRMIARTAAAGAAITLLIAAAAHTVFYLRIEGLRNRRGVSGEGRVATAVDRMNERLRELEQAKDKFASENMPLLRVLSERTPYPRILVSLGEISASRVWLSGIEIDSDEGTCEINGRSSDIHLVSEFMLELKKTPYFSEVDLSSMEKGVGEEEKEIAFGILCEMK